MARRPRRACDATPRKPPTSPEALSVSPYPSVQSPHDRRSTRHRLHHTPRTRAHHPRVRRVVRIRLGAPETAGKYTLFNVVSPPGGGPPTHPRQRGRVVHRARGSRRVLRRRCVESRRHRDHHLRPKGTVHTYKNVGDTPLRMLVHISPAGFETFLLPLRCRVRQARPAGHGPHRADRGRTRDSLRYSLNITHSPSSTMPNATEIRSRFPRLAAPCALLDNAGGSQLPSTRSTRTYSLTHAFVARWLLPRVHPRRSQHRRRPPRRRDLPPTLIPPGTSSSALPPPLCSTSSRTPTPTPSPPVTFRNTTQPHHRLHHRSRGQYPTMAPPRRPRLQLVLRGIPRSPSMHRVRREPPSPSIRSRLLPR